MDARTRGEREYIGLIGARPDESLAQVKDGSPDLYDSLLENAFGGPLAHAELSRRAREIATLAILAAAGGAEPQLAAHTRAALHNGLAASELRALAEHVAIYAGYPRAIRALEVLDSVLRGAGEPSAPRTHRIRLPHHNTVAVQHGEAGPAVILIHALGLDWRMWEPVMARLAIGRQVFAYDIRGHGRAAGFSGTFTMTDVAADLIGVLDALKLERAHVVGLSYGGAIAQTAAVDAPERFDSLALLATTDFPFDAFEARARSGEVDGMEAQIVPSLTRWLTPDALALDGWGVRYARELVRRGDTADWAAAWRAFETLDVQGRLEAFEPPTLVLSGARDASTTPEIMSAIGKRIPSSVYRELPDTPHMQTLEQPALVADALDEFLPAHLGSGRSSSA